MARARNNTSKRNNKKSVEVNKTVTDKEVVETKVNDQPVQEENKEVVQPEVNEPVQEEVRQQKVAKPKTFNQRLGGCKTFECLYEEFKDDPEYSKVILPLNTYVNFIRGNSKKTEQEYLRKNYDLYTTIRILLKDKDRSKVNNYLKLINRAFVLASDVFNEKHILAYDYRWSGTDKSRREWLALFTLLIELSNPKRRREVLKIIDFNQGLKDIGKDIADNLRTFYTNT